MTDDLAARVEEALSVDVEEFQATVREEAAELKAELDDGAFDNANAITGLEYEFYAVDTRTGRDRDQAGYALRRVPRRMLELIGFEKELGLHNAEMTVSPQPLNIHGIRAQEEEVRARLSTALDCTRAEGMRLVSDGLWTIPPEGETARSYLTDSVEDRGIRIATNMSDSARYHGMANTDEEAQVDPGLRIEAPHVSLQADTVMPEALITSIQPHYQVPQATDLPQVFNYALRVAGPLLAVCANSPFFPPDLYDDDATAEDVLRDGWMEHRVSVFETVLNDRRGLGGNKVWFPEDVETVEDAVDDVAGDPALVPMPVEGGRRFDDAFAHFRRKHGTYWRWVRPVFGGATRSAANARVEFRPIPGQPTVRDSVAVMAVFAGLMESLPRVEHPVADLEWADARDNFYAAMREGLDARMTWITNDGQVTHRADDCFEDLFAHAEDGLTMRGLSAEEAAKYVRPLRKRARMGQSPAAWKRDVVRERLADGEAFADAVTGMQREYISRQEDTLLSGSFVDWIENW